MKDSVYVWIVITTLALVTVTIMSVMNLPFNWVFYSTVLGQELVVYMVYKVLKDNYTTDKTFKDFYEDNPMGDRIN